jgi:hypothetical protein
VNDEPRYTPEERLEMAAEVDRSFEHDRERADLARTVATSEALRKKVLAQLNGHVK